MPNRIQIRHGTITPGQNDLLLYELGWDSINKILYIKNAANDNPIAIGGKNYTDGILPIEKGGTGQTSIANIQAGKDGEGNTITSTYLKLSGGTLSGVLNTGNNKIINLANGTNSTDAATFGQIPIAYTSNPVMNGTASPGSSVNWSRGDHIHPTDTTRMAANLKGVANGVAELDSNSKVAAAQASSSIINQTITNSSYTLSLQEAGKMLVVNSTADVSIIVPEQSSVNFPEGTEIEIMSNTQSTVTISGDTNVNIVSLDYLYNIAGIYGVVCLKKMGNDYWLLAGALS